GIVSTEHSEDVQGTSTLKPSASTRCFDKIRADVTHCRKCPVYLFVGEGHKPETVAPSRAGSQNRIPNSPFRVSRWMTRRPSLWDANLKHGSVRRSMDGRASSTTSSENGSDERSGRMAEAGLLSKMTHSYGPATTRRTRDGLEVGQPDNYRLTSNESNLSESPSARHSIDRGDTVARAPSLAKLAQVPPLRRARKSSELPSHPDSPFIDRHCSSVRVLQTAIRLVVSGMDVLGNNIVSLLAKIITRGSAPVIPPVLQSPG
ncbi:hypothetical protein PRIPAC_83875, partial [Pristionchus pacificus]|uniref:Uncharacterized protein n=1 Tax=Pristionchus pacificus TaxID=54126 RepID=A0A2A6BV47_PRIPA